jgi:thioesterase domain-containing protein
LAWTNSLQPFTSTASKPRSIITPRPTESVDEIAQRYRGGDHGPIILIGHSLGADAVMQMAQSLDRRGVPIALVIPFDGTASFAAPKNVACVLNLTQRSTLMCTPAPAFTARSPT